MYLRFLVHNGGHDAEIPPTGVSLPLIILSALVRFSFSSLSMSQLHGSHMEIHLLAPHFSISFQH